MDFTQSLFCKCLNTAGSTMNSVLANFVVASDSSNCLTLMFIAFTV